MSANPVVIQGVIKPDGTLELDGRVPLPAGRVSVTLQPVPYSEETDPFFVLLRGIWAESERAGIQPRTRQEIDTQIQEFHDDFNGGVEDAGRLQEECRRLREEAAGQESKSS